MRQHGPSVARDDQAGARQQERDPCRIEREGEGPRLGAIVAARLIEGGKAPIVAIDGPEGSGRSMMLLSWVVGGGRTAFSIATY